MHGPHTFSKRYRSLIALVCSVLRDKEVCQAGGSATQAQLSTRIDEEAARRTKPPIRLANSHPSTKKKARIEQVQGSLDTAVKTIEPKGDDARGTGVTAGKAADAAMMRPAERRGFRQPEQLPGSGYPGRLLQGQPFRPRR
jgi:hypothetical protein